MGTSAVASVAQPKLRCERDLGGWPGGFWRGFFVRKLLVRNDGGQGEADSQGATDSQGTARAQRATDAQGPRGWFVIADTAAATIAEITCCDRSGRGVKSEF
jgi:hypothetical protein